MHVYTGKNGNVFCKNSTRKMRGQLCSSMILPSSWGQYTTNLQRCLKRSELTWLPWWPQHTEVVVNYWSLKRRVILLTIKAPVRERALLESPFRCTDVCSIAVFVDGSLRSAMQKWIISYFIFHFCKMTPIHTGQNCGFDFSYCD